MSNIELLSALEVLEQFKENNPDLSTVSKVLSLSEEQFVRQYAKDFGNDSRKARRAYWEAQRIQEQVTLLWGNIKDAVASLSVKDALFNNLPTTVPKTFIDHQRAIPGYTQLFGNLDFLEGEHCRSIFGPAAYFVDLMRFIERNISQNAVPEGHRLEGRQPHLFYMPLDCENTFTLVPYIDLVNEVLEDVLQAMARSQDSSPTPYEQVAAATFPPSLPFHLPLEELRLYLEQLKLKLQDIYRLFGVIEPAMVEELLPLTYRSREVDPQVLSARLQAIHELLVEVEPAIAREELLLSPQEYALVEDAIAPADLAAYYGSLALAGKGSLEDVETFIARMGLSREELNTLLFLDLSPDEVQAGLSRLFFINNTGDQQGHLEIESDVERQRFEIPMQRQTIARLEDVEDLVPALDREPLWTEKEDSVFPDTIFSDTFQPLGAVQVEVRGSRWLIFNTALQRTYAVSLRDGAIVIEDALYLRLNNNETPTWLTNEFTDQGVSLSKDTKVLVDTANLQWRVWDADNDVTYVIRRVGDELVIFDAPYDRLANLTPHKLDRIYRFLKLSRKLGWSYGDLDWALRSLQGSHMAEKVLRFDGTNDFVAVANTQDLTPKTFTLEAWVMIAEAGTHPIIANGNPDGTLTQFMFWVTPLGQLAFFTSALDDTHRWENHPKGQFLPPDHQSVPPGLQPSIPANRRGLNLTGDRSIAPGVFTHVAVTVNGITQSDPYHQLKFYINGVLDSTWSLRDPIPFTTTAAEQVINIGKDLLNDFFSGQIAEVRLWDKVRSEEDITKSRFHRFTGREEHLIGYWPLHETMGLEIADLASRQDGQGQPLRSHPGVLGGHIHHAIPVWTQGDLVLDPLPLPLSPYALHFNGRDAYVSGKLSHLTLEAFTLEAWFSVSGDQVHPLMTKGNADQSQVAYGLGLTSSRQLTFSLSNQTIITSEQVIPEDELTHVAVVVQPQAASPRINLYINGDLASTSQSLPDVESTTDPADFYLGRDFEGHYLRGTLKEVRIWAVERSAAALQATLHHQLVGTEPGLVAYWRLDDPMPDLRLVRDRTLFRSHLYPGGDPTLYQPDLHTEATLLPDPIDRQAAVLTFSADQYPVRLQNSQLLASGEYAVDPYNSQQRGLGYYEQFSLQLWFKPQPGATADEQILFTQGDRDTGLTFYLAAGKLYGYAWCTGFNGQPLLGQFAFESANLAVDQWHHLTFVYDETQRDGIEYRLYVDGERVAPLPLPEPMTTFRLDQVGPAYLGGLPAGGFTRFPNRDAATGTHSFNGQITDLRIWDIALASSAPEDLTSDRLSPPLIPPATTEHLVAYLPMTENYGRRISDHEGPAYPEEPPLPVPDQSPSEHTAILDVGPDPIDPKWQPVDNLPIFPDTVLTLSGEEQFFYLPYASELALVASSFTLELWVRLPALGSELPLVGSDRTPLQLCVTDQGQLKATWGEHELVSEAVLQANIWHHLAWRCDRPAQIHTLFIDGQPNGQPIAAAGIPEDALLYLGRHRSPSGQVTYLQGDISEVRCWSVSRDDSTIAANWNHRLTGAESDLVAYWVCDADHRLELRDRTTAAHPLQLDLRPDQDINSQWVTVTAPPTLNRQVQGLNINQSDEYVPDYIDLSTYIVRNVGTIELWMQFSRQIDQVLLDASRPDGTAPFRVEIQGQALSFRVGDTSGAATTAQIALDELAASFDEAMHRVAIAWQFEAATATTTIRLSIDEFRATAISSGSGVKPEFPHPFVGLNRTNDIAALRRYQGQITQVRVWDAMRSPLDLQRLSHADLEGGEPGLLVYLPMDEGRRTILNDLSSDHPVKFKSLSLPHPNPTWLIADYAIALNGRGNASNGRGDAIDVPFFTPGETGSLELWVKFDLEREPVLLDASTGGEKPETNKAFVISVIRNGGSRKLRFRLEDSADANFDADIDLDQRNLSEFSTRWHHLVATWRYEPQSRRAVGELFLDDLLPASIDQEESDNRTPNGEYPGFRPLYIGKNRSDYEQIAGNPLKGQVRHFRAWNRALSAAEVEQLRNAPWQGLDPAIDLPLNEGTGTALSAALSAQPATNAIATLLLQGDQQTDRWQVIDRAVEIDHPETFITCPAYVPGTSGTIELWVKFARDRNQYLLDASGEGDAVFFVDIADGQLRLRVGSSIAAIDATSFPAEFDTAWHYIAAIWKYEQQTLSLHLRLDHSEAELTSELSDFPACRSLYIGIFRGESDNLADYRTLQGQVSQLRIWDRWIEHEELRRRRHADLSGSETGLLVHLPIEAGSGHALANSTGNQDATLMYGIFPDVRWVRNPATLLQWQGDYGVLPSTAALGLADTYTLEAWVNLPNLSGTHPILGTRGPIVNAAAATWAWGIRDGSVWVQVADQELVATDLQLSADTWHHLVCQYDREMGSLRLSLDSQLSAASLEGIAPYTASRTLYLALLQRWDAIANSWERSLFRGLIAEVRIWSGDRTEADLAQGRDRRLRGDEPGLIAYWTLTDEQRHRLPATGANPHWAYLSRDLQTLNLYRAAQPPLYTPRFAPALDGYNDYLALNHTLANQPHTVEFWFADRPNQWQHLAAVYSDGGSRQLFLNGALVETPSPALEAKLYAYRMNVGDTDRPERNAQGQLNVTSGLVTDLRLWNSSRTATEIYENYQRHLTGREEHLWAYWKVDEGRGDRLRDAAENLLPATLIAGLENTADKWQPAPPPQTGSTHAIYLDGRDDHLIIGDAADLSLDQSFTVEAWVNLTEPQASGMGPILATISLGNHASDHRLVVGIDNGHPYISLRSQSVLQASQSLENGWHHLAWQFELAGDQPAQGTLRIFVDDLLIAESSGHQPFAGDGTLVIGRGQEVNSTTATVTPRYFRGGLGEIRVWRTVRTAEEIKAYRDRPLVGDVDTLAALTAYWIFDEPVTTVIPSRAIAAGTRYDLVMYSDATSGQPTWSSTLHPVWLNPLPAPSLSFDGDRQHLATTTPLPLAALPFTLEVWVKVSDWTEERAIARWGVPGSNTGFELMITTEGRVGLQIWQTLDNPGTSITPSIITTDAVMVADIFTHIALVTQTTNDNQVQIILLVNGTEQQSQTLSASLSGFSYPLIVGQGGTPETPTYFKGLIKEVRLWQGDRTADLAATLYHPLTAQEPGLLSYWPLAQVEEKGRERLTPNLVLNRPPLRLGGLLGSRKPTAGEPTQFWDSRHRVLTLSPGQALPPDMAVPGCVEASYPHRAQYTIEVWFLCRNLASGRQQVIYSEGDGDRGLSIYIQSGTLYLSGWNHPIEESYWQGSTISTNRLQANHWHHVALILNGKDELRDDAFRALLDGRAIDTRPGSQLWGLNRTFTIGGLTITPETQPSIQAVTGTPSFDGQIREVRVWATVRTDDQIRNTRYALPDGDRQNLLFYWDTTNLTGDWVAPMELPDPMEAAISSPALPLIDLAYLRQLQAEWKQPVERLCALWIPMRHIGRGDRRTLFDSVFNPPGTEPYWSYSQRLVWEIDSDEPPQRQIRTRLLSTLRRSQADLQIMVRAISGEDAHRIVLDGAYLTLLYRFNLLAGLLRLSMADLVGLIAQLQRETAASEAPLHDLANFTLRDVRLLKERADWMRRAGITLAEYEFLVDDIQSQDIGLPYTEAMVIDTATILLNQSSELLVNNRSLATDSPTISDAAADKIYRELKDRKIIDELALEMLTPTGDSRSVSLGIISPDVLAFQLADPALKELQRAILLAVAEALNWATSFDGNELGVSKQALIEEGIIEADPNRPAGTTGLILKPIAPNPDRPAAEQVLLRDLVTNRLDLQVSIPNEVITRLQDLRRAFDATLLNDFATLLDTDAERLLDTMQNTSGQLYTRGVWDIPALMQQLSEIANQQTLATDSPLAQDLRQLSKVLILLDQFSLSEQETQLLLTQSNSLFGIQPERLFKPTLADLQRLHTFEQLKRAWGDRPDSLISVLQEQTPLHEFTGWRQADILKVAERLQIPAGTYHTIPAIERLHRAFGVLGKLGSDPAYLFELADTSKFRWPDSGDRSFAIYQKLAATLFDLVRAQYSEDQWPKAYKPLHDRLAVQKRDALTALILEVLGGQLGDRKTPNILYEYLLIDVQTGSAVETSRIVQGIASLQLYVQRCLMNLEHGVNPEQIPMNEWEWMKNYRVWEANRKVFLYPENYIEPELRDTKTPLFEELQDSLQQGNITAETVANAYTNYLNQFAQVANLTIVGSYYDTSASPRTGHALTFDGKGFIEVSSIDPKAGTLIPQNAATDTTDPSFTIELWVKSTLPGSQRGGIASAYNWGFPNNQSNGGWILEVDRSHFRFHVVTESAVTESANGNYFQSIATSFSPDEWYHLAVTYDSNNNNDSSVRLYLNGEEKGSISCSGKIVYPQNLTSEQQSEIHFVLGTRKDLDYEVNFAGQMREIRIWSTARSPEQIRLTMFREIKNVDRDLPQDERSTLLRCWNRDDTETNNTQDEGLTVKDFSASQENLSTANNRIRWKTTPLIEAIYQDEIDEDTILYLIGRDDTTQEYYIRELINQRRWTPWRKLGITINAQFVSPVFAFNRLFLFWAEIQDHVRSEPRRRIGTNGGKPIDQLGDEIILKTNDPDGSTINRRTNIVSNKLDVIEFVNLPLKRPVLKFSFVNFSQEWIEPQTVNLSSSGLKDKELSEWERLQPKWLRVYAQRWRGSDVAPLVQRLPEPIDKLWVTQLDTSSYLRVQVPNFSTRELTFSFWLRVNRLQSETTTSKEKPRVDTFTLVRYGNSSNSRIQMQLTHKPTTIGENLQLLEAVEQSQAAITAVHQAWQLILTLLNTPTSENLNSLTTHDSSLELLEEAVGNALDAIKSNTNNPRTLLA
ncbi:MAG: LamG-like jellyroll fold domain-containing protein, partial [Elainellaceae cyanobacterium]